MKRMLFMFVFVCGRLHCVGQAVDNTASFRMMNATRYIRMHYENDFFTGHDLYYTQGVNLELVNPKHGKFIINKLFYVSKKGTANFGISLEHNAYTPSSITHNDILYGDRPFAADVFLKFFTFSSDPGRRMRFTSSLSIGMIGSVASGYTIQKTIHGWLSTTPPKGWQNQIANDVILNYEVGVEKNLLHAGSFLLVNGMLNARAGTLNDKLTTGFVLMIGKLNPVITSAFSGNANSQNAKFSTHFYFQPLINAIAYDATLQGGILNRNSPYTLSSGDVNHITVQANYGIVITYHAVSVEYFKSAITKEFTTGVNHRWGGLRLGVRL